MPELGVCRYKRPGKGGGREEEEEELFVLAQEPGVGGVASSFPLVLESNEVKGVKVSGSRMRTRLIVCRSNRRSPRAPPRQLVELGAAERIYRASSKLRREPY